MARVDATLKSQNACRVTPNVVNSLGILKKTVNQKEKREV